MSRVARGANRVAAVHARFSVDRSSVGTVVLDQLDRAIACHGSNPAPESKVVLEFTVRIPQPAKYLKEDGLYGIFFVAPILKPTIQVKPNDATNGVDESLVELAGRVFDSQRPELN